MTRPISDLQAEIASALPRLRALSEARAAESRGAGKWVRKEILGHLIDSAANNHQRFVRARFEDSFVWPGYEQEPWVAAHRYRERPWTSIVDLWSALNSQVLAAMETVPAERLTTSCVIGDNPPMTLGELMDDYVRHMRHHLAQILSG